jgi:hypothetical protein
LITRAIWKVTLGDLLTNKQRENKFYYVKKYIHTYISYFSAQAAPKLRYLPCGGISFCMPVSKKSGACDFRHVLTPFISSLLLKLCDPNQFFRWVNRW